ncbi:TRAM, LAG1 and CLN8 domain-containing protein [Saccharata proteae CBS 121410]|uniref:TRAM, LAG1 and CLN8 domain-containing protein n=1 Tax=Saccharata proteae CBS 121410 TaxID=1314787 RepID=A0A9P4M327_9PEZI|nr:TRAM, LAG1 and CLN8 domain-containing protein [Saccharata proteae CBS 121410]
MHDPFPFAAPAALQRLVQPYADHLSLQTLPMHMHEIIAAALLYHLTCIFVSPALSTRLFPSIYTKLNRRTRLNWDVHVVSLVQSLLINVVALWISAVDEERSGMDWRQRVWGYTGAGGLVQALACGYFVWDLWISVRYVKVFGLGLLAHAVSALAVFSLGFRPFVNFYGPTFILYELSSPFLNIHWFCDKLNLTGSSLQLYNGILLLFSFFAARLCWGTYQSLWVFFDIYRAMTAGLDPGATMSTPEHVGAKAAGATGSEGELAMMRFAASTGPVPMWLAIAYLASNLTLTALNFYWFGKMIETVRKRFDPPLGTKRPEKKGEKVEGRGSGGVEVGGVRSRRRG